MPGRPVLITGCSSGIGYHAARGLRERGYRVFATARRARDVERLAAEGFESLWLDVRDEDSIARALEDILDRTGGELYGLFNNAGFGQPGAVEDLSLEALREQFDTNVFGAHEVTRQVIPVMRRRGGGRIVQNSSVLGFVSLRYRGAYNASKHALEGLSDTLRLELAGTGIHVSIIEPGPITSRFRDNAHAAYRRHIDAERSAHRQVYEAMERRLTTPGPAAPFTQSPEAVLRRLVHALESPRPRVRYYVTFPTHLFAALKRILPHRALDRVLQRVSDREGDR
ncbi:MAG: SDR family oxidoreductase [Gammaproteobacteria bacterium]|nr:SDR family oxidoreductase [Gammaproteobacteria bacterium]